MPVVLLFGGVSVPRAKRVLYREGQRVVLPPGEQTDHVRTTAERGYGAAWQRASRQARANATTCAQCGCPFTHETPSTGGHVVAQRNGGTAADGAEAQCPACNFGWRRTGL